MSGRLRTLERSRVCFRVTLSWSRAGRLRRRRIHLKVLWEQLRAKHPSDFTASSEEIAAWHELEAAKSELGKQWFAAAFHLKRLAALRPVTPSFWSISLA